MYVPQCMQSTRYGQYFCACSASLLITTFHMHVIWPSPTIPLLTSPHSPIGAQLTKEEVSWVVSIKSIGMLPGAVLVGFLMDKIGRKKILIISSILSSASWVMIIFSRSLPMLLAARAISGFGGSLIAGVISIYIGEISEKSIRGRLLTIISLGAVFSGIIVLGVGPFVSFKTLALIGAAVSLLMCMVLYLMPESPYYLVKINQRQAAYKALSVLSQTPNIDKWLEEIEKTVQNDEACKLTLKNLFIQINYRKAFIMVLAMKSLVQFGGLSALNAYLQTIMDASQTSLSVEASSVICAVIQIPCVFLSAYLVDKLGRRPLMMISSAGCAAALIGEGVYFYLLQKQNADLSSVYFLPSFFLVMYFVMMSIGISNLVLVLPGELFTSNVKKVGGGVFAFYTGLLSFVSTKIFNPISETWGMHAIFWTFGCVCVLGIFFGLCVLPETKGKSFEEIQDILHGKKRKEVCASVVTTKL